MNASPDDIDRLLAAVPPVSAPASLHADVMAALEVQPVASPAALSALDWPEALSIALGAAVAVAILRRDSWNVGWTALRDGVLGAIATHPPSPMWWQAAVWACLGSAISLLIIEGMEPRAVRSEVGR